MTEYTEHEAHMEALGWVRERCDGCPEGLRWCKLVTEKIADPSGMGPDDEKSYYLCREHGGV